VVISVKVKYMATSVESRLAGPDLAGGEAWGQACLGVTKWETVKTLGLKIQD